MSAFLPIPKRSELFQNLVKTDLALPEDYVKLGNHTANKIFDILRMSQSVDRVIISGSMGKKTELKYPKDVLARRPLHGYKSDYDLVAFFNWEHSPEDFFKNVPDLIADVLKMFKESILNVKVVDICVQFETINGYHFDLVPAINFVRKSSSNHIKIQKQGTYKMMKKHPIEMRSKFSAGLAESVVAFGKSCDPLIHDLVRICKYWLYLQDIKPIYGVKPLIETVAMKVGISVQNEANILQTEKLYVAFQKFLLAIHHFEKLNITIYSPNTYSESDVPKDILESKPLVLDPVNPYNNLANNPKIDEEVIDDFCQAAAFTFEQLEFIGNEEWENILCDVRLKLLKANYFSSRDASCMDACSIM